MRPSKCRMQPKSPRIAVSAAAAILSHFRSAERDGQIAELHRKRTAESATFFAIAHFHDFHARPGQQIARSLFDSEFAQSRTTIMIGRAKRAAESAGGVVHF